jgi:hypothetical protein
LRRRRRGFALRGLLLEIAQLGDPPIVGLAFLIAPPVGFDIGGTRPPVAGCESDDQNAGKGESAKSFHESKNTTFDSQTARTFTSIRQTERRASFLKPKRLPVRMVLCRAKTVSRFRGKRFKLLENLSLGLCGKLRKVNREITVFE